MTLRGLAVDIKNGPTVQHGRDQKEREGATKYGSILGVESKRQHVWKTWAVASSAYSGAHSKNEVRK